MQHLGALAIFVTGSTRQMESTAAPLRMAPSKRLGTAASSPLRVLVLLPGKYFGALSLLAELPACIAAMRSAMYSTTATLCA